MTADQTEQLFVAVGARESVGTLMFGLLPIDQLDATADEEHARWFKPKKALRDLSVGAIYSAKASATGVVLDFTRRGRYADDEAVIRWRVLDDAAEVAERMRKIEKEERLQDTIANVLAPIRDAYQKTDARGKRAIEALVLDRLRRH